jgi:PEP-CTERM motif
MKTKYVLTVALGSIVLLICSAVRASADTFNFTISGSGIIASGVFITNPEVNGTFLVTGISGTQNGQVMTLLAPGGFAGNDNLLYATPPLLDFAGLSYDVAGAQYNVQYNSPGHAPFVGYGDFPSNPSAPWVPVNFTLTAVPEPSSMLLLGSGPLGLVHLLRHRRRLRSA